MAFPFAVMPTLRQFIDKALSQGCKEGFSQGAIVGPKGPAPKAHYLRRGHVIYILPNIPEDERLAPTVLASMVRGLDISGFEHLTGHLDD